MILLLPFVISSCTVLSKINHPSTAQVLPVVAFKISPPYESLCPYPYLIFLNQTDLKPHLVVSFPYPSSTL